MAGQSRHLLHLPSSTTGAYTNVLSQIFMSRCSDHKDSPLTGDDISFNSVLSHFSIQGLVWIAVVPEPLTYAMAVIAMTTLAGTWHSKRRFGVYVKLNLTSDLAS